MRHTTLALVCFLAAVSPCAAGGVDPMSDPRGHIAQAPGEMDAIPSDNGLVGVYADPQGTSHCINIPTGQSGTMYIIATTGGQTSDGFSGAEFRIQVKNPTGYFFTYSPPPGNDYVTIGGPLDLTPDDPFDFQGLNIAFRFCQTQTHTAGDRISLGTIQVFNISGGPTQLLTERNGRPSNPSFGTPLFTRCDAPAFSITGMRQCASDTEGQIIASRSFLNTPGCTETQTCPSECPGGPCVTLKENVPSAACVGEPVVVRATATNCSNGPESIDIFVRHQLVQSFASVAPQESVTVVTALPMPQCTDLGQVYFDVGAVARNTVCPEAYGAERTPVVICDPSLCTVAVRVEDLEATASDERVSLRWSLSHEAVRELVGVGVQRAAAASGPYEERARAPLEPATRMAFEDQGIEPGRDAWYRLVLITKDGSRSTAGPVIASAAPSGSVATLWSPFEPAGGGPVQIRYAVGAHRTEVRLAIHDARGRLMWASGPSVQNPGQHTQTWDRRDAAGARAARGVYFVRLEAGGATASRKLLVLHH
jgi:hypothetical protein